MLLLYEARPSPSTTAGVCNYCRGSLGHLRVVCSRFVKRPKGEEYGLSRPAALLPTTRTRPGTAKQLAFFDSHKKIGLSSTGQGIRAPKVTKPDPMSPSSTGEPSRKRSGSTCAWSYESLLLISFRCSQGLNPITLRQSVGTLRQVFHAVDSS